MQVKEGVEVVWNRGVGADCREEGGNMTGIRSSQQAMWQESWGLNEKQKINGISI